MSHEQLYISQPGVVTFSYIDRVLQGGSVTLNGPDGQPRPRPLTVNTVSLGGGYYLHTYHFAQPAGVTLGQLGALGVRKDPDRAGVMLNWTARQSPLAQAVRAHLRLKYSPLVVRPDPEPTHDAD